MSTKLKVESLINYNNNKDNVKFDEEYQSIFKDEGDRKSHYILEQFNTNEEIKNENLSKYVFVSIGGADGSEAESILMNSNIEKAILLELSTSGCESARKKSKKLSKELNKELIVCEGDATQKLDEVIQIMENYNETDKINGLVLSIQSVLHELPRRSKNFRLSVFFGQLFSIFENNMFFCREPIKITGLPDIIEIKVGDSDPKRLTVLADLIDNKLSLSKIKTTPVAGGFINIDSTLGIELLHKLLRSKSVSEFKHELGEQLTSVDPDIIIKHIEKSIGKSTVRKEQFTTDGFKNAWDEHSVEIRDEEGHNLSLPITHARFIAISINKTNNLRPNNTSKQYSLNNDNIRLIQKRTDIRSIYGNKIEHVKNRFYVYGIGLGGWTLEYKELIQQKVRENVDVKILALSPREEIFKIYFDNNTYSLLDWKDYETKNGSKSRLDSKYLQEWVFEENIKLIEQGHKNLIELKFYSCLPVGAIMIADNTIFYSPSLVSNSDDNTTMVFELEDKSYSKFNTYFEDLWSSLELSQPAISKNILYNTSENGCIINRIRKRRKYLEYPQNITRKYVSYVEHAKDKLLYNELSPIFLQAANRNTKREVSFIRAIEKKKGEAVQSIVDLGCGVGRHASLLSEYYDVTAIDISIEEINLAKKTTSSKVNYLVGDMRNWNIDNKADMIICMWSTFNYLSCDEDLKKFIICCSNNLHDSGLLILDLKNPEKLIETNHVRESYSYPYEISIEINKSLIDYNTLNGVYNYHIENVKTGESVVATDQEINKKYSLKEITSIFTNSFKTHSVYGDYNIQSKFESNSERMIVVLQKE